MMRQVTRLFGLLLVGQVFGAPTDEFEELTSIADGDILPSEEKLLLNILPGYTPPFEEEYKKNYVTKLARVDKNSAYIENVNDWIDKGVTSKGLTFNVYDDEMREAAVALFRLFLAVDGEDLTDLKKWAEKHINTEMYLYALRLASLYGSNIPENHILPPFILNPRYFVNSEAISKAFTILDDFKENKDKNPDSAKIDPRDYTFTAHHLPGRIGEFITVNSNYSGWNIPTNGMEQELNYFREDIALNSYHLGLHLLHPYWMTNEELDESFPRHAEHYYYAYQQLMARYLLEKEHLGNINDYSNLEQGDYFPYLTYRNGLAFPSRCYIMDKNIWDDTASLKTIDIAIKECIDRGIIIMGNGTTIKLTEDGQIEDLARLIRANFDGLKTAKVVRSIFGYGRNRFPNIDKYNPSPSVLHHPETSLRDAGYWFVIKYALNYFTEFKQKMEPFDLTNYETEDIIIQNTEDMENLNFTTYFQSYRFTLNHARNIKPIDGETTFISVRQKRLKHKPIEMKLAITASTKMSAVLRIYLGPQCGSNCWQEHDKFFELDTYNVDLEEGQNIKFFTSRYSKKHSFDSVFDTILLKQGLVRKSNSYSIFKFPDNLLIPRGTEKGLNLTLFVMVTPAETDLIQPSINLNYNKAVKLCDSKPFGFPFHRPCVGFKESASNYKFFNVTVYHKTEPDNLPKAYFAPNLY